MSVRGLALRGLATLGVLGGGLALAAAPAPAELAHSVVTSFGPGGPGAGTFGNVQGIAIDESSGRASSGDVYVYDIEADSLYKFDAAGEKVAFSESGTNAIAGIGGSNEAGAEEVAVDSSSGPDAGDVFVANNSEVKIYDGETGESLGALTGGEMCGVAVSPTGEVYVGVYPETVEEYTPTPPLVTDADLTTPLPGFNDVCNVAVDAAGSLYAAKYDGGVTLYGGAQIDAKGSTLAVDPFSGDLYVDEGDDIAQFSSAASGDKALGSFAGAGEPGALGSISFGVAVNGTSGQSASGDVYAFDAESKTVEILGSVVVPDVSAEPPAVAAGTSAILNGTVNPDETEVTACMFEYGSEAGVYPNAVPCSAPHEVSQADPLTGDTLLAVAASPSGLQPNTFYYYRLAAANRQGSNHSTPQTFKTPPVTPAVDDRAAFASNVSQFEATLNGTIDPLNALTSYHFAYGASTAYGSLAPEPDLYLPIDSTDHQVSQALSGLQPGTTYHFALVATSAGGTQTGPDETFTTPGIPVPLVSAGTASAVAQGVATLAGTIDPRGWETTYAFQYGTSTSYGLQWPTVPVALGGLEGAQGVTIYLEGLQPATTYHYRLLASNGGGTEYGADETFTTTSYPVSIIQETPIFALPVKAIAPKAKVPARAQKLAKALKACRRKPKGKRAGCEKQARRKYGPAAKKHI
jgi:hypothetical protein